MALKPGDTLSNNHYRITRQLGRGGFGFVYLAQDTLLGEDVAIKELIPALVGDEAMLKRFLAEARATMRLTHKHIVRTHNVFQEGDNYYIVMEYMAGGSLEERLPDGGSLPVEEAVRVAAEVCEGLACAHEQGVVHCDLKPANILFDASGTAKAADFGIAHVSGEALTRSWMTPAGFVAGTLPYMSPEQTDGVRDDPRIDIYALGAVLYRMLTGQTYLDFDPRETPRSQSENVQRIFHEEPQAPSTHIPRVPARLDGLVLKTLAKDPEDRYATASELEAALAGSEAESSAPVAALPDPLSPPTQSPQPGFLARYWPVLVGAVALVVAIAIGIAALSENGQEQASMPAPTGAATVTLIPTRVEPLESTATPTSRPTEAIQPTKTTEPTATQTPAPTSSTTPEPTSTPLATPSSTSTPVRATPRPTRTPFPPMALNALPTPVQEYVTDAGTWRAYTNGDSVQDVTFYRGLLWAATTGGVMVWDTETGEHHNYTTLDGLPAIKMYAIEGASDGALWIAPKGEGISRFHPLEGTWQTFTEAHGLGNYYVEDLVAGPDGALWFVSSAGGTRHEPISGAWRTFSLGEEWENKVVDAVAAGQDGTVWIGSHNGLHSYDPAADTWRSFDEVDGLAHHEVRDIAVGSDGTVWASTVGGISRYNKEAGAWQGLAPSEDPVNDRAGITIGPNGGLWVGLAGGGLGRYDPSSDTWHTFEEVDSFYDAFVTAGAVGLHGDLWFGRLAGGLRGYDSATNTWRILSDADALAPDKVNDVAVGVDGTVWFGTSSGLSRYDPVADTWRTFTKADGLARDSVNDVALGPDGLVWLATHGGGVSRYDPASETWRSFSVDDGLANGYVEALAIGPDGTVWCGTESHNRSHINRYDPASGEWQSFPVGGARVTEPGDLLSLAVGADGSVWCGSSKRGLWRYDSVEGTWRNYLESYELDLGRVEAAIAAPDGTMWFPTMYGASVYDPATDSWQLHKESGLGHLFKSIARGPGGSFWFASARRGVYRYDPAAGTWEQFTTADGLLTNNVLSVAVAADGDVWLVTDGGVSHFEPAKP